MMGGIDTDEWGRTSVAGLFAAGETACTGVHGANRLASNSLLEGLVFGARAGEAMQQSPEAAVRKADRTVAVVPPHDSSGSNTVDGREEPESAHFTIDDIRDLMWHAAGLFRTRERLEPAVGRLSRMFRAARERAVNAGDGDIDPWRCFNLATVALLVGRAALRREESRGGHYRADFPARDDLHWKVHVTEAL
jgi:L-aspartate oxidase